MRVLAVGLALSLLASPAGAYLKAGPNVAGSHHRLKVPGGGVEGIATAPTGAYSFRKLLPAYGGSALRLLRASDSQQQDIGFVGNDFDTGSATTFCNATTCTLVKWYDQSGNARDLSPAVTGPALLLACTATGQPCARFFGGGTVLQGGSLTPATGVVSLSVVSRRVGGTGACAAFHQNGSGFNRIAYPATAFYNLTSGVGTVQTAQTEGQWHLATGVINAAGSYLAVDGATTGGTVTGSVAAGVPGLTGGSATNCDSVEAVFWDNYALTPDETAAFAANQRNYWAPLPLDTFATPAAAYSLRKLKSSYTGPGIRLRRASDNLEQDINFLSYTGFTGAPIDTAAAAAHCAATTCGVVTWYDQSGNARHITAGGLPAYVASCSGGQPCARMVDGTQYMRSGSIAWAAGKGTMSAVANRRSGTGICYLALKGGALMQTDVAGQWIVSDAISGAIGLAASDAAWHAGLGVIDGAASVTRLDTVELTGTIPGNPAAGAAGFGPTAAGTVCDLTESIVWDNYALTAGERTALTANQRGFWGF